MTDDEIQLHLASRLVGWRYTDRHLEKTYATATWKSTMMVVNAIGHLCEIAWHHPELIVTYNAVRVRLNSHDVGGVTLRDIELAEKLDAFLLWQPDAAASGATGGLTGLPDNPQHRYILTDTMS